MMPSFRETSGGVFAMPDVLVAVPVHMLSGQLLANRECHRYSRNDPDWATLSRSRQA